MRSLQNLRQAVFSWAWSSLPENQRELAFHLPGARCPLNLGKAVPIRTFPGMDRPCLTTVLIVNWYGLR